MRESEWNLLTPESITKAESYAEPRNWLRWLDRFTFFWNYPVLANPFARLALLGTIMVLCALRAYTGLKGTKYFSHDAFMLLDGAWRMINGQRPHIDFYSHVGVLTFVPTVLGLMFKHGAASGFGYGQAITGLFLGVWAYLLSRRYLNDVLGTLMTLAVTLMAIAPSPLGFPPFLVVAPAMTYNRAGYAVFALLIVEAMSERAVLNKRIETVGGISTGAALAVLFFLKITYFALAVFFIVLMAVARPQSSRRLTAVACSFVAVTLAISSYFGFNLLPMLQDLQTVAHAKRFRLDWYMLDEVLQNGGSLAALAIMAAVLLFLNGKRRSAIAMTVGGVAICLISLAMILGNYQQSGCPLTAFSAVVIIDVLYTLVPPTKDERNFFQFSAVLLASVFVFVALCSGLFSTLFGALQAGPAVYRYAGMDSPVLRSFIPIEGEVEYRFRVDDGLGLIRRYLRSDDSIMSLDFTNPFSYGLQMKPAPGGTTVLQYETTFDDSYRQAAQSLFGFASLVIMPKPTSFSDESLRDSISQIYGSYLASHYDQIGDSTYWILFRRK